MNNMKRHNSSNHNRNDRNRTTPSDHNRNDRNRTTPSDRNGNDRNRTTPSDRNRNDRNRTTPSDRNRNNRNRSNRNIQKLLKKVATALALILTFSFVLFLLVSNFGNNFDDSIAGTTAQVKWSEVNLRKDHSTSSEIVGLLKQGEKVVLTGNTFEYSDGPHPSWYEVQVNNSTGWVVAEAVDIPW